MLAIITLLSDGPRPVGGTGRTVMPMMTLVTIVLSPVCQSCHSWGLSWVLAMHFISPRHVLTGSYYYHPVVQVGKQAPKGEFVGIAPASGLEFDPEASGLRSLALGHCTHPPPCPNGPMSPKHPEVSLELPASGKAPPFLAKPVGLYYAIPPWEMLPLPRQPGASCRWGPTISRV